MAELINISTATSIVSLCYSKQQDSIDLNTVPFCNSIKLHLILQHAYVPTPKNCKR